LIKEKLKNQIIQKNYNNQVKKTINKFNFKIKLYKKFKKLKILIMILIFVKKMRRQKIVKIMRNSNIIIKNLKLKTNFKLNIMI